MNELRFSRLSLLMINTCPGRLRGVIDHYYRSRGIPNFEEFLNINIHELYHLRFRYCCCGSTNIATPINRLQWDMWYTRSMTRNPHGGTGQCPCQYKAVTGITSDVLDTQFCCLFLTNLCPGIPQPDVYIIRQARNDLIQASSDSVDEQNFNEIWTTVEQALLNLSRLVSPEFEAETLNILQTLKNRYIDNTESYALRQIMEDSKGFDNLRQVSLL